MKIHTNILQALPTETLEQTLERLQYRNQNWILDKSKFCIRGNDGSMKRFTQKQAQKKLEN